MGYSQFLRCTYGSTLFSNIYKGSVLKGMSHLHGYHGSGLIDGEIVADVWHLGLRTHSLSHGKPRFLQKEYELDRKVCTCLACVGQNVGVAPDVIM